LINNDFDGSNNLNLSYNNIIKIVSKARLDQQSQFFYFQHTLEHISTGVISFKNDGILIY